MRAIPELIAITTGRGAPEDRTKLLAAVSAGLPGVLIREPSMTDRALIRLAGELRGESESLWIAVHDRAHLAVAPQFDAVHLGFRSLTPREARQCVPPDKAIGFSSHAGDGAQDWEGADYLFHGPVKETPSKSGMLEPTGFVGLEDFCAACDLPVLALGGLTPSDAGECLRAGALGAACLSGISMAEDPAARVTAWRAELAASREVQT